MSSTFMQAVKPKEGASLDRRYQEVAGTELRLLDTEAFQLKKEELVSQLRGSLYCQGQQAFRAEGKLLNCSGVQDRTGG